MANSAWGRSLEKRKGPKANEHEDRVVPERLIKFEGQALGIVNGSVVNSFTLFQFVILEIQ